MTSYKECVLTEAFYQVTNVQMVKSDRNILYWNPVGFRIKE